MYYIFKRIGKFSFISSIKNKPLKIFLCLIPDIALVVYGFFSLVNAVVVFLHLLVFMLFFDLLGKLVRLFSKKKNKRYFEGAVAIIACFIYLSYGFFNCNNVVKTVYDIKADKNLDGKNIKICEISDLHLGAVLDGNDFKDKLDEIQKSSPDILAIVGDFVDDSSKKEDIKIACDALKNFKARYGIYYVYGNHDRGYLRHKDYSSEELASMLKSSGVKVLEDEVVTINKRFTLIGRKDRVYKDRKAIDDLVKGVPTDNYRIVLDHQPNDYKKERMAGADLVLSGHTHGGQFFPFNLIVEYGGFNDMTYGMKKIDKTNFVVSSGIADWELDYKIGCVSEYVIINIS